MSLYFLSVLYLIQTLCPLDLRNASTSFASEREEYCTIALFSEKIIYMFNLQTSA